MRSLIKHKKGMSLTPSGIQSFIVVLVLLVVLLKLGANLIPEAQDAGDELCASGVPFASLFSGDGIVFIIVAAALILVIVFAFLKGGKK